MIRDDTARFPAVHLIAERIPTARKEHRCAVCGLPIHRGERHYQIVARNDDALNPRKALLAFRYHLSHCPEAAHG